MLSSARLLLAWTWRAIVLFSGPLLSVVLLAVGAAIPSEVGLRVVGFVLQVFGVGIVLIGISDTRAKFKAPTFWAQTRRLFADFPLGRRPTAVVSIATAGGIAMVGARARGWFGVQEDASFEQRIAAIEMNLTNLGKELSATQRENDDRARAHSEEIKRERSEREAEDRAIHEKIKESETSGLHLNWSGVWWLFFGTACSTFPGELARFFGGS
jgi:hypothetical protein